MALPPADAFGPSQNAFSQAITGEGHPAFYRLIRQQLADGGGALTRLPGVSDMTLQTIVERIEAQFVRQFVHRTLAREVIGGCRQPSIRALS